MSCSVHPHERSTPWVGKKIQSSTQSQQELAVTDTDTAPSLGGPDCGPSATISADQVPFSYPKEVGKERKYLAQALRTGRMAGDGDFNRRCSSLLSNLIGVAGALMTPSCTHALEMAAILFGLGPGDEVIMPSFTFTSTANAFVLRGVRIVFVDIRPDTLNLDEALVEEAINSRTKAIVPMHYAGVACEMDALMAVAGRYGLWIVEDAAQAIGSGYKGRPLGSFGHLAAFSFHETKNLQCGEGGALLVNDASFFARAEIIREKGTNRSQFFRGEVAKYNWVDLGSSHLLGELPAAFLYGQLQQLEAVTADRLRVWEYYRQRLTGQEQKGNVELPVVPVDCSHNAHIFYVKVADEAMRERLLRFLKEHGIGATFHYVPLHSAPAGRKFGVFHGEDRYTTKESQRLLRLPLYYRMTSADVDRVCDAIERFFE
ncbi:MAG: dTDP-4-amino-4,6-dideoxygalactose transaminase [Desulfovibrionales bacterium]|nr:dTDP-4-amino-4,6-dideoxygalactose transaminase [Desulfovibrionales bacterium]